MCFTPIVSISIAIVEFTLASILLLFFPKSEFRNFFAIFIYLLGLYQFTEFMLCSGNAIFWAMAGFVTYSFLPAISLHAVLRIFKKKFNIIWVYLIPSFASFFAIITPGFIIKASCEKYFISVETIMTSSPSLLLLISFMIYIAYYFGFLFFVYFIILKDYSKQKNKIKREIELIEMISILLMVIPTLVLLIIFPVFGIMFPSVLCAFGIFVAISAFIGVYLKNKLKKKK
ncbi:hypothetical protein KAI04_00310 [Candidatus Pacearchaeota archaeon]|nr:hypothetical protein [Candidatus Pacearchaeota archaeon]